MILKNRFNDIEKYSNKKDNGATPYWNTATIVWLISFSRIQLRLRKAEYDNPQSCWHIIGEGDFNSFYSGFNI